MEMDAIQIPLPGELGAELRKMRRNPAEYSVFSLHKCRFCTKLKTAHHLINAKFGNRIVGSWCSEHGWLFFDSVALPPTERLTPAELEDRRLTERRKKGPRQPEAG